jgi:hypothetical protein
MVQANGFKEKRAMDFITASLLEARCFRVLTLVDRPTWKMFAAVGGQSTGGPQGQR